MATEAAPGIGAYDPKSYQLLSFHDQREKFLTGEDTPRNYLERCLEKIASCEEEVKAWAYLNADPARAAADDSSARYAAGKPLSIVDGMPLGIKDLIETVDMPTEYNCELFKGNQPIRDAASVYFLRKGGAIILGKTVTVTLGGGDPSKSRNPFDTRRTPGGSSSGSCAAIGPCARLDDPPGQLLWRLRAQGNLWRAQSSGRVFRRRLDGSSRRHRRLDRGYVDCRPLYFRTCRRRSGLPRHVWQCHPAAGPQTRTVDLSRRRRLGSDRRGQPGSLQRRHPRARSRRR
jgi:hypothetical protein